MNKRDPFFDNAKFLLIILLVFGHLPLTDDAGRATIRWVFSFHMPLFVFISGYFTRITDTNKYWQGVLKFAETYVVFSFIQLLIPTLLGKHIGFSALIHPRWTLWYLLSLIWWRIMLYYIPSSIRNNHKLLIAASVVLCLAAGWVPLNSQLSFQRTFAFLPFFTMGYVAGANKLKIEKQMPVLAALFALALAWCVLYFTGVKPYFLGRENYMSLTHYLPVINFAWRAVWLVVATVMSYCFLCIVPQKEYRWTHFGELTLFIYLYHAIILLGRHQIVAVLNLPTTFLSGILYTVIVLLIIWLLSKFRIFHWLLNPISSLMRKKDVSW